MADKGIIFSAPMVRALLNRTKTQTRRVISQKVLDAYYEYDDWCNCVSSGSTSRQWEREFFLERSRVWTGDCLYVREQWSGPYSWRDMPPRDRAATGSPQATDVWYWADGNPLEGDWERPRPSIHMPRWASRLTLTVTDVRVQRLQDISDEDAQAEGMEPLMNPEPVEAFRTLWNSLHGPDAWDANPWVCALTFTVQRGNIDQVPHADFSAQKVGSE